ncbi:TPA: hypothetical protein ACF2TB_002196, partial [Legionella pneumophila]
LLEVVMGGQLHLKNGKPQNRENTCVSGYTKGRENYALSNFDDNNGKGFDFNDPDIGKVHFSTSEHYLHFQKLTPDAKREYRQQWETMTNPGQILDFNKTIPSHKLRYQFQPGQPSPDWDRDKVYVQMQINATKYAQSSEFRDSIQKSIDIGKGFNDGQGAAVIIEDTSTAKKVEKNWGTGPDGTGTNILGNTQTAFANMVASGQINVTERTPSLQSIKNNPSTKTSYDKAEIQFKSGFQKTLIKTRANAAAQLGTTPDNLKIDTSQLGTNLVAPAKLAGHTSQATTTNDARFAQLSQKMHSAHSTIAHGSSTHTSILNFSPIPISINSAGLSGLIKTLNQQKIPVLPDGKTEFDQFLSSTASNKTKIDATHLLTSYAIKSIMGNLSTESNMSIVDNIGISTATVKHDPQAIKIKFNSPEEAMIFAKKLSEQGINSHTFPGQMKTPQGKNKDCIFLTQGDLEKITEKSRLASKESVAHAYQAVVTEYKQKKLEDSQDNQLSSRNLI